MLVVDDDEGVRDLAGETLRRAGLNVLLASDGLEGLELFRRHTDEIQVVVLDRTMPTVGGDLVFEEIRRIRPGAAVILMSGYSEDTARDHIGKTLGSRTAKPRRLAGSVRFVAATGDAVGQTLYLATPEAIYRADLSQGRPEPQLLVHIDVQPERLLLDAAKQRLFALDTESGRLYLVDLRPNAPQVYVAADGLGWPTDVSIDPTDGQLYISDTKDKQIWRLQCDDVRCAHRQVFARSEAFRAPSRLAVAADRTVWVSDLKAQKIFAIAPDGSIRQTIASLAGNGD